MTWNFREEIEYIDDKTQRKEITKQDERKFELLIKDYLDTRYPLQQWTLTKSTRDGNRDIEAFCSFAGKSMWAEVKYVYGSDKNLSSRRYDSTLVSAELNGNVIQIFFVTNAGLNSPLKRRVAEFCFLNNIERISFIDKAILEYWISEHKDIQERYFKGLFLPVKKESQITLREIMVIAKKDTYTCYSVISNHNIYPLYDFQNYLFQAEILMLGMKQEKIQLYCNDIEIYAGIADDKTIHINFDEAIIKELSSKPSVLDLKFIAVYNHQKIELGGTTLQFSCAETIFAAQGKCLEILNSINTESIYNIYGCKNVGKSWVVKRIKNENLKMKNNKVIYINFLGNTSDIAEICRLIFLLLFDYYDLHLSSDSLLKFIENRNISNSVFSHVIILELVHSLINGDYARIKAILANCVGINSNQYFEYIDCFNYKKIFFLDNLHKLTEEDSSILNIILTAFQPFKGVTFILTNRNKYLHQFCRNIELKAIENKELLNLIQASLNNNTVTIDEILPDNHMIIYPVIVSEFLKDIEVNKFTPIQIGTYYTDYFKSKIMSFLNEELDSDDEWIYLIYIAGYGISIYFYLDNGKNQEWIDKKQMQGLLNVKAEYVYPANFVISDANAVGNYHRRERVKTLFQRLINFDETYSARYAANFIKYYPEFFKYYYPKILERLKQAYKKNEYYLITEIYTAILEKATSYIMDEKDILYLKYLYGFSLMHSGSSKKALCIFKEINHEYRTIKKDNLYFTNYSEIIDASYWRFLNSNEEIKDINMFRGQWKSLNITLSLETRSYLTVTNRMMIQYLVQDKFHLALKWFYKNLKLAYIYKSEEHFGYTLMDYAKGIYHLDQNKALYYLERACLIFKKCTNEKRRFLDCQCEIAYLKLILNKGTVIELENTSSELFQNQYWTQFYKSLIKLASYYATRGNIGQAKRLILEVQNVVCVKDSARINYLIALLKAFCFQTPVDLRLENPLSGSYHHIIEYNNLSPRNKAVFFKYNIKQPYFYLDPRVW